MSKKNKIIIIALITILLAQAGSFTSNPAISPTTPDTTDNLVCSWNVSADTIETNITWYRNDTQFSQQINTTENSSTISSIQTVKGERWNCTVSIRNTTHNISYNTNTTIYNADPGAIEVVNSTNSTIGNYTNVTEDLTNIFNLTSIDPDGDPVTYSILAGPPAGASLNPSTGIFTWIPEYTNNDVNITFVVTDDEEGTPGITARKVLFNIFYVNDAPEFNPSLENQTVVSNEKFNYLMTAIDEESNWPIKFDITSVTPSLNINSLAIINTSNTTAIIYYSGNATGSEADVGNYTINITINDSLGANTTSTFNLEIQSTNYAPNITLVRPTNITQTQGGNITFEILGNDTNENDTLNFTIAAVSCTLSEDPWLGTINTTNSSAENASAIVDLTVTDNRHVICPIVRITLTDGGAEDFEDVFLNISNTNDPPKIEVLSSSPSNFPTFNTNISNLTSYGQAPFRYQINATDNDTDTYEGENLTYSLNETWISINATSGLISFIPNSSYVGNFSVLVNVSDDEGLYDTEIMLLKILNNTAPLFNLTNLSCAESVLCVHKINSSDIEGDNITFNSSNSTIFPLTQINYTTPTNATYNQTPLQSYVGNHTITVFAVDEHGAERNATMTFSINNTEDSPLVVVPNTLSRIVETHDTGFNVYANDSDFDLPFPFNDSVNVTFNYTFVLGPDIITGTTQYFDGGINRPYIRVLVLPGLGQSGNYTVNFTAIDNSGLESSALLNFTVLAKTEPPNITYVMPYGQPYNASTIFNLTERGIYNSTNISIDENITVLFNVTVVDDNTSFGNLAFEWYFDGVLNATTISFNRSFGFYTSGLRNITFLVNDLDYENSSYTWLATVADINRPPTLQNSLENLSVNGTETFNDYLKQGAITYFIDPDDDPNRNYYFEGNETSLLNYTVTECALADFNIIGHDLKVTPTQIGTCRVTFTAYDSDGLNLTSNNVTIDLNELPAETAIPTPTSSSGGGGSSRRSSVVVPINREEKKLEVIKLVVPELVNIYRNKTIEIPVIVMNTWNETIQEINLSGITSNTTENVTLGFSEHYFESLRGGEERNVTLTVSNYRLGQNFEVRIDANVTEPEASDSALVLINSIEQLDTGDDLETKVTFAQDLLNENPECAELNELLEEAITNIEEGESAEATKMVDGVIDGCKYLVSVAKKTKQTPQTIVNNIIEKAKWEHLLIFLGLAIVLVGISLAVRARKGEKETPEKEKPEEKEFKPYWP